jgi:hypothetical protein
LATAAQAQTPVVPAGLGTSGSPFLISNINELVWVRGAAGSTYHYRLTQDIDASETKSLPGGFQPITTSISGFNGNFDGAGFTIHNLAIDRPAESNVGLFGIIRNGAAVRNLNLSNAVVLGGSSVGILAGLNLGSLSNCTVHGRVEGRIGVGGVVGENADTSHNYPPIRIGEMLRVSANVQVRGVSQVGGLAGVNEGSIDQSFATGEIEGFPEGLGTGGLVGANLHGRILRSASSSIVSGHRRVGGLVGFYSGNTNGLIQESFSIGPVTGRENTGGLVGQAASGARTQSSYWNASASRQSKSAAGTVLDNSALFTPSSFTNWALGTVWDPPAFQALPRLSWLPDGVRVEASARGPGIIRTTPEGTFHPPGTEVVLVAETPFPNAEFLGWIGSGITTADQSITTTRANLDKRVVAVFRAIHDVETIADLRKIGREPGFELGDRYRLVADLDFANEPPLETIAPDATRAFTGIFEGNGHTLRGLQIGSPTNTHAALFGWVGSGAEIRDLRLIDVRVTGKSTVAGIAARNAGRILGSAVQGRIHGELEVGGIAAVNQGTIEDSQSSARLSGRDQIGGITASNPGGRLLRVRFTGGIEGLPNSHYIGGICAWNDTGMIEDATVSGMVSGSHFVGGFVGRLDGSTLGSTHGTNLTVIGRFATGGLVGSARDTTFTETHLKVRVSGIDQVGGLVGQAYRSAGTGTQITSIVSGARDVGGLVGHSFGDAWDGIDQAGSVSGDLRVGGWAGTLEGGGIGRARSSAAVTGRFQVGGGVGKSTGTISDAETSSDINGVSEVGGLVGANWAGSISKSRSTGHITATDSVGGLVGVNLGSIVSSSASGPVEASDLLAGGLVGINRHGHIQSSTSSADVTAPNAAGGLVGENYSRFIVQSAASGTVNGDYRTGGLVGVNYGGEITGSAASGLVLGGNQAGGLVGENTVGGVIERSASSANVHAISEVGGLVGRHGDSTTPTRITESVATGVIVANGLNVGGLVGYNGPILATSPARYYAAVENSYHLAGQGNPGNPPAGTPLTRAQLHQQASFPGWNFISDWSISEGTSTPRPSQLASDIRLKVVVDGPGSVTVSPAKPTYAAGDVVTLTAIPEPGSNRLRRWFGTDSASPQASSVTVILDASRTILAQFQRTHAVRSIEDLASIGRAPGFAPGDYYFLTRDIDASATRTWNDPETTPDILEGFPPIGSDSAPFTGVLDGQGHTIHQLGIHRTEDGPVGLLAVAGRGAQVHDLQITDALVQGRDTVGALAGNNWGGTLERIRVQGRVTGQRDTGLVTGIHQADLSRVVAEGAVEGGSQGWTPVGIGGITGESRKARTRDAHFNGSIHVGDFGSSVGGIAGSSAESEFDVVTSTGDFSAPAFFGGILGDATGSLLSGAWSSARLSPEQTQYMVGGLVGYAYLTTVRQSGFGGSVTARAQAGGIAGGAFYSRFEDTFMSGSVTGTNDVGGLVGQAGGTPIERSYVNGPVTGSFTVGPIVGMPFFPPGWSSSVYWNTETVGPLGTSTSNARSSEALRDPATYVGWDLTSVWAVDPLRNNGFPYLRALPYTGIDVPPSAIEKGGAPLLNWIAANRGNWNLPNLGTLSSEDLLAAFLLDRPPSPGLHQKLTLELDPPLVLADQVRLAARLTLDGAPVDGPLLQARWLIETTTDPEGPWRRIDATANALPPDSGVTPIVLPTDGDNLFRARLEPAAVR